MAEFQGAMGCGASIPVSWIGDNEHFLSGFVCFVGKLNYWKLMGFMMIHRWRNHMKSKISMYTLAISDLKHQKK